VTPADELVEVLDEDGHVIDVVSRAQMRRQNLRHRAVFVAVQGGDGRLLVHRRSEAKDVWPGWWDLAVGGVVAVGEAWADAAVRELAEEVGVTGVVPEPLGGDHRYDDADVRLVGRVYRVVHDGPFTFADGEVVEARFVTRDELDEHLGRDQFLPDSVALVLPYLWR
jgi:isopentenyldiphosphate isomerase